MAVTLTEDERELLAELVETPGWKILVLKIIAVKTAEMAASVVTMARSGDAVHNAGVEAGKIEGMFDVVRAPYDAAKIQRPDYIKALKEFKL